MQNERLSILNNANGGLTKRAGTRRSNKYFNLDTLGGRNDSLLRKRPYDALFWSKHGIIAIFCYTAPTKSSGRLAVVAHVDNARDRFPNAYFTGKGKCRRSQRGDDGPRHSFHLQRKTTRSPL
eukprot:Opistho-2@25255